MRRTIGASRVLAATAVFAFAAGVAGADEKAMEVLKQADEATKSVAGVEYDAKSYGIGALAVRVPVVKGHAMLRRSGDDAMGMDSHFRLDGTIVPANPDAGAEGREFVYAFDGETARMLDASAGTITEGAFGDLRTSMAMGSPLRMIEYTHPTPFQDELNSANAEYEGRTMCGDVVCDVVYVEYGEEFGGAKARWYFGVEDHLPRRVERLFEADGKFGATVQSLTNVKANPEFKSGVFTIEPQAGQKVVQHEARPSRPELLAVGEAAPEWSLKDPSGETHSLSDYRGNLVLMDFWATWCGPCKRAMPGMQRLHEEYGERGLKVFGVNTWENGDPAKYMKDQGYTYGLLLEGDDVATTYGVSGIPTFYLVGPDGKIVFHAVGSGEANEKALEAAIKKHLETDV